MNTSLEYRLPAAAHAPEQELALALAHRLVHEQKLAVAQHKVEARAHRLEQATRKDDRLGTALVELRERALVDRLVRCMAVESEHRLESA